MKEWRDRSGWGCGGGGDGERGRAVEGMADGRI